MKKLVHQPLIAKKQVLVYVSRLSQEEAAAVFNVAKVFQNNQIRSELLAAIQDVAEDRLSRATGCLDLARALCKAGDHESIRAAVNRAYYAAHHCIRAMVLHRKKSDPDDHAASIKVLEELLNEPQFAKITRLNKGIIADVKAAMNNRHVADYSPYDESRHKLQWLHITKTNWKKAAEFNIALAEKLLAAARRVV
jgi:uncharacterized protein (UPF0332 family)